MAYQIYEVMLLFAVYSIGGWALDMCIYNIIEGKIDNRGICRGPYAASFGIGALLILTFVAYAPKSLASVFGIGIFAGLIVQVLSAVFIWLLCGKWLVSHKWYYIVMFGFGAIILFYHLNPLLLSIIGFLPPWLSMILLLAFTVCFVPDFIDGVYKLWMYKQKSRAN